MRKLLLIIILLFILLLSGCVNAKVIYSLNEDNIYSVDYTLDIQAEGAQVAGYVDTIEAYWENQGLTSHINTTDGQTQISGNKTLHSNTKLQAAEAFSALLSSDTSLFDAVSFEYVPNYEYDEYTLDATISLEDVIRQSNAQNIPEDELMQLIGEASSGQYTLSITLPGEMIETNADDQESQNYIWHLEYGKTTNIKLHTRLRNDENIAAYNSLQKKEKTSTTLFWISVIFAVIFILALILYVLARRIKKIRASKVRIKKF